MGVRVGRASQQLPVKVAGQPWVAGFVSGSSEPRAVFRHPTLEGIIAKPVSWWVEFCFLIAILAVSSFHGVNVIWRHHFENKMVINGYFMFKSVTFARKSHLISVLKPAYCYIIE